MIRVKGDRILMVVLNKIYIKIGDDGMIVFGIGERCLKNDLCIEVYGMVDEINVVVGFVWLYMVDGVLELDMVFGWI